MPRSLRRARAALPQSVFISGKPKGKPAGDPPNRILKPLRELVAHTSDKKRLLEHTDRVLIVGSSERPYACEKAKDYDAMVEFFQKVFFLPLPDYPSRVMLWREALERQGIARPPLADVQTLARISRSYASGAILRTVRRTVTPRRLERLERKPFSLDELIGPLAKEAPVYGADDKALFEWYLKTLGIDKKTEAEPEPKAKKK